MPLPSVGIDATFLTERQAEVLALRSDGLTQREIADRTDTTVSNISAIESAARDNIAAARRTLGLAAVLESTVRFTAEAGTDLRELVDTVYEHGDDAGIKVEYTAPQLSTHLHDELREELENRRLTASVGIGITRDGAVVTFPSTEPRGRHGG